MSLPIPSSSAATPQDGDAFHTGAELIIVDEIGYIPFDTDAANLFFQLVTSRYEQGSIMVTSNLPFGRWG